MPTEPPDDDGDIDQPGDPEINDLFDGIFGDVFKGLGPVISNGRFPTPNPNA